jgi:hypothetical protein
MNTKRNRLASKILIPKKFMMDCQNDKKIVELGVWSYQAEPKSIFEGYP